MTDTDLFVLAPWVVFACGVAAIMVMGLTRSGRARRVLRRRPPRPRRSRRR
jgi:hypothetical protein